MLKTRVISAIAGLLLFFAVVLAGKTVFCLGVLVLTLIGLIEYYKSLEKAGYKPVKTVGFIALAAVFSWILADLHFELPEALIFIKSAGGIGLGMYLLLGALFIIMVAGYPKYNIVDLSLTLAGVLYLVFFFSCIVLVRNLPEGKWLIWLVFLQAWAADTFGYFTGMLLGKHKLSPRVSPKKTIEGSVGGWAGCVLTSVLFGLLASKAGWLEESIPLYHFAVMGLAGGLLAQVGDLTASAIKRHAGVKDFGNIMPGHGGVLDRFDSVIMLAPAIYFYSVLFLGKI